MSETAALEQIARIEKTFKAGLDSFKTRIDNMEIGAKGSTTPPQSTTECSQLRLEFEAFQGLIWETIGCLRRQLEGALQRVDALETHARRKVLLLHGVKENATGNLETQVVELLKKIDLPSLTEADIAVCHRLGRASSNASRNRAVLVRFAKHEVRTQVWRNKSKLKGTGVSMTEFLTPTRQVVFMEAKRVFGVRNCWTQDASIFVVLPDGTRHGVKDQAQLSKVAASLPKAQSKGEEAQSTANKTGSSASVDATEQVAPETSTARSTPASATSSVRGTPAPASITPVGGSASRDLRPRAHIVVPAKFKPK